MGHVLAILEKNDNAISGRILASLGLRSLGTLPHTTPTKRKCGLWLPRHESVKVLSIGVGQLSSEFDQVLLVET